MPAPFPIIQTKLEPPRLREGLIVRQHLLDQLESGRYRPLTLVHAAAGYGKSTIVAQWLAEPQSRHVGWIWLDGDDNELERFASYLVAAVDRQFPGSCQQTRSLLSLPLTVPPSLLASTLLNELNELPEPFVLVLEEYETIQQPEVHDFVKQLVAYLPEKVHLVLVSRAVPPFSLARLRERGLLNEISEDDLRLTGAEAAAVLAAASSEAVDEASVGALAAYTEGWVGGLQMTAAPGASKRLLRDFFIYEVLERQPEDMQQFLLESSLLERFCPSLLAAVCDASAGAGEAELMVERLQAESLFVHTLETPAGWYRYHGLFHEALRQELAQRHGPAALAELHRRAASWLQANGEAEAALTHWLAAGEDGAAARLVESQAPGLLAAEAISTLERWLRLLPADVIQCRPSLLIAQVWVERSRLLLPDLEAQLKHIEYLQERSNGEAAALVAGVSALSSDHWYWRGDAARCRAAAELARHSEPAADSYTAAYALARAAMSQQMVGAEHEAMAMLDAAVQQPGLAPGARAQLLLARALVFLSSASLFDVERTAIALQRLAEENSLDESLSWAHYLLGSVYYEWDRREEAADHFRAVIDEPGRAAALPLHDSYLALALIYEGQGQSVMADTMVAMMSDQLWARGSFFIPTAGSFRARLALQRGDLDAALRHAEQCACERTHAVLPLEIPLVTRVRVLIAQNSAASLKDAREALSTLQRILHATHNRLRSVEVLCLRALVLSGSGDTATALDVLQQALVLAERGGMVRVFVDLGAPMAALLYQLTTCASVTGFAGQVLAAFPRVAQPVAVAATEEMTASIEALTGREWEVLVLMSRRLSNKEIAQSLVISPHTVKKHASNIYQKLHVSSRRQAIARAQRLQVQHSPLPT